MKHFRKLVGPYCFWLFVLTVVPMFLIMIYAFVAKGNNVATFKFTLDNYSTYSIVYQIYIIGHGWLPAVSNGTESVYNYTKPFSKIRINLVPTSEKQYLIDYWNKDC